MDTTKGELSFVLNGVNLGVAFDGIPLDKPLVPCVLLKFYGNSVELITQLVLFYTSRLNYFPFNFIKGILCALVYRFVQPVVLKTKETL